jgi:hypothetical protein
VSIPVPCFPQSRNDRQGDRTQCQRRQVVPAGFAVSREEGAECAHAAGCAGANVKYGCGVHVKRVRGALIVLGSILVLFATGCSSFNRDWKAARSNPAATASAWDGEWRSDANGHHGRLRAILTPGDGTTHQVRFRASYAGIFRFGYAMDLAVRPGDGATNTFRGTADLGMWGSYSCDGTMTSRQMEARYDATHDRGVFKLHRGP